jgi:CRISPR-associated protein Cas2
MSSIVVVYDISDNKTRRIVGEILEGYGKRVNRSVFECQIKNTKQRQALELAILNEIDIGVDSVRIYSVCANCIQTSSVLGDEPRPFERDAIYWF